MKKIFIITMLLFYSYSIKTAELKDYRDTPLLCTKVEENHLPFGEYFMVRSYRNVTQLLVSVNTKIILYTDRDNQRDSEIFVSAYSRLEKVHLNVPAIQQNEFDTTIEKLIRNGDSRKIATIPFYGGNKFMEEIKRGVKPDKTDGEYFIYLKKNGSPVSLLTISLLWKKLTLRNILNENNEPSTFYNIYIGESYDKNINRINREYTATIKNL